METKRKFLSDLHDVYQAGNLRILAGAGASIQSGFPGWEDLNRRLLQGFLARNLSAAASLDANLESKLIEGVTDEVASLLGRDGVAEFVLQSSGSAEDFHKHVAASLYRNRGLENLYLSDLQRQIAGLAFSPASFLKDGVLAPRQSGKSVAKIYTTNFDPLLEMGIARACREGNVANIDKNPSISYRSFRQPPGASDAPADPRLPQVRHLHGWVDPDGQAGGQVVYAESHYVSLQNAKSAPANVQTEELFGDTGATVIIGMSLTDPNLRRLLYSRSREVLANRGVSIYSFTRRRDHGLAEGYAERFWGQLNVKQLPYSDFSELPGLIRDIQWGAAGDGDAPGWFAPSAALTKIQLGGDSTERWFRFASPFLTSVRNQIDRLYVTEARENIGLTFFAPASFDGSAPEPRIYQLGSVDTAGRFESSSPEELMRIASVRNLDIRGRTVQGLAGLAFQEGALKEATAENSLGLDFNFTGELREAFDRGSLREWRSMLAVPVLGGPFWLPLGVICVTSNFGRPFWKRLRSNPAEFFELTEDLLRAGRLLIESKTEAGGAQKAARKTRRKPKPGSVPENFGA